MRYLVTGAAGFIGSHLVEHLLGLGDEVIGVDDLSAGSNHLTLPWGQTTGPWQSMTAPVAELPGRVPACDGIFHLAGHLGVESLPSRGMRMLLDHPNDAVVVARLAKQWNCPLLAASSSEVYGTHRELCREHEPVWVAPTERWRSGYAISKLAMEAVLLADADIPSLTIVRLFNVTGPRQRPEFVLPRFITRMLRGEALPIYGDGQEARSYSHVMDVVPVLVALLARRAEQPTVVNVGHERARTTLQVAEAVQRHAQRKGLTPVMGIQSRPEPPGSAYGFMRRRIPSTDRLEALGLQVPDRWLQLVADTWDYWEART